MHRQLSLQASLRFSLSSPSSQSVSSELSRTEVCGRTVGGSTRSLLGTVRLIIAGKTRGREKRRKGKRLQTLVAPAGSEELLQKLVGIVDPKGLAHRRALSETDLKLLIRRDIRIAIEQPKRGSVPLAEGPFDRLRESRFHIARIVAFLRQVVHPFAEEVVGVHLVVRDA